MPAWVINCHSPFTNLIGSKIPRRLGTLWAAPHPFRSWWHSRNVLWPARSRAPCHEPNIPNQSMRDRLRGSKPRSKCFPRVHFPIFPNQVQHSHVKAWKGIVCVCNKYTYIRSWELIWTYLYFMVFQYLIELLNSYNLMYTYSFQP